MAQLLAKPNSAVVFAHLGGRAKFVGKIAQDEWGAFFARDMIAQGVAFDTHALMQGPATGRVLSWVTPDGQRTISAFPGATGCLSADEVSDDDIKRAHCVFLEGYAWGADESRQMLLSVAAKAKSLGAKLSYTTATANLVQAFAAPMQQFVQNHIEVLFCNDDEARALTGQDDLRLAANALAKLCPQVFITMGANGVMVIENGYISLLPIPAPVNVIDTTGAGDAFAGAALHALLNKKTIQDAALEGMRCAGHIIGQIGARPKADFAQHFGR
jgi:sugar/nucleoside kinase (ribokinase family)